MKNLKLILAGAALLVAGAISAQKWSEGKDLSYLKGQKEVAFQFVYDNLTVGKKGKTETDYVAEKVADNNKKEAGKGDAWAKAWVDARQKTYEPKFEELFNKTGGDKISGNRKNTTAKYTVIIRTLRIEPGYNIGVMKQAAFCDFEITIVETANPTKVLSKGVLLNQPGSQVMGYDYDVASRVQECYAKGGKTLGKTLGKAVGK
jgi:hypothetical protein